LIAGNENVAFDAIGKWTFVFIPAPSKIGPGTTTGRGGLGFVIQHITLNNLHNQLNDSTAQALVELEFYNMEQKCSLYADIH